MRQPTLAAKLKQHGERNPDAVAFAIIAAAKSATRCRGLCREHTLILKQHADTLMNIETALRLQTTAMGRALAQTDGAYLTTIPGIGVVLAGHIVAEIGMSGLYGSADRTASYAGIIPRDYQTGGPESPVKHGHLPKDCNRALKDCLLQAANHVGTTPLPGPQAAGCHRQHDLMAYYQEKDARGEKSRLGTARKLLRIINAMASRKTAYQPTQWFEAHQNVPGCVPIYLETMLTSLAGKWKTVGLNIEEDNELGNFAKSYRELVEKYRTSRVTTLED